MTTDQRAPTPSLEEARAEVERVEKELREGYAAGYEWVAGIPASDLERHRRVVIRLGRAEVIREVETALDEVCLYLKTFDTSDDARELTARLRALSQGGEGKEG